PINRGIIKSFNSFVDDYQYIAIDGHERCLQALDNIDSVSGVFFEMSICEYGCVNGPCSIESNGGTIKANADIRSYVQNEVKKYPREKEETPLDVNINFFYPKLQGKGLTPTEDEITAILAKTGKHTHEDELNCGACGYDSCREKAWAVYNGFADIEVCLPYMRERAESMAYEIIQNNPNGIVTLDHDINIIDINSKARDLFGIDEFQIKGRPAIDFFDTTEFMSAIRNKKSVVCESMYIPRTNSYIHLTVNWLKGNNIIFGVMKDITTDVDYNKRLTAVKMKTLETTDEVIKKQMRVAQEIASLLGETTAETKVALLKLKQTLSEGENKE
ncbi:MAG: (Fe-S)-binding protein, partial [Rikenellaceae bacterium]